MFRFNVHPLPPSSLPLPFRFDACLFLTSLRSITAQLVFVLPFRCSYGTYGPAFEDGASAFPTPVDIPLDNFYSCGDCVFPGVGVPAVAVSGANVANSCVGPLQHLRLINRIQEDSKALLKESA